MPFDPPRLEKTDLASMQFRRRAPIPDVAPIVPDYAAEFEQFWAIHPRPVDKKGSYRSYLSARASASADEILKGAKRYAASREGVDQTFTAHSKTWLNQERWMVAPVDQAPTNGKSVRYILERQVFVNTNDPSGRSRYFIQSIMPKARELPFRASVKDTEIARKLGVFLLAIEAEMHNHPIVFEFGQGPSELLWEYLDWIGSQDWPDFTLNVFSMTSAAFSQWRSEKATTDGCWKDPLTGISKFD